jgi:hypothetical protein
LTREELARFIRSSLDRQSVVEIDGLGHFRRNNEGRIRLVRANRPSAFVAYAVEDGLAADRLCDALEANGWSAWLDRRRLLPGQNWPRRIEEAIASSDCFIACFSTRSVKKRGGFQAEVRYALDCARRVPLDDTFVVPVRLDDCRVPAQIQRETQYVDLFPDWDAGLEKILTIIESQRRAA